MDYKTKKQEVDIAQDILGLVDCYVTKKEIAKWSDNKRNKIVDWAGACHLRASDNNNKVPPRPRFKSTPVKFPKRMQKDNDLYS